jgi:RNA polymerase sigma factor (sigma-70 family)
MMISSKSRDSASPRGEALEEASGPPSATRRRAWPSDRPGNPLERVQLLVKLAVRRVTGASDPDFEDIMQTSLASVLVALGDRPIAEEVSGPWVVCVARNTAIDRLRARRRERRVFDGSDGERQQPSSRALEPDHLMHVRDELRRFDVSLRRISAGQSMVVYLHDVLGHQLPEIAAAIGISVTAAQSRLIRGRRALKRELLPQRTLRRVVRRS